MFSRLLRAQQGMLSGQYYANLPAISDETSANAKSSINKELFPALGV